MNSVKKYLLLMIIMLFSVAGTVRATDTPPPARAEGNAFLSGWQFNEGMIGGFNSVEASGVYNITGKKSEGEARTNGSFSHTMTESSSSSSSNVSSEAAMLRGEHGEVSIRGRAEQQNWLNIQGADFFASGSNFTSANYDGIFSGRRPSAEGDAKTNGSTAFSTIPNGIQVETHGGSLGNLRGISGVTDPTATGAGSVYTTMSSDFGSMTANGFAAYNVSAPTHAEGSLDVTGSVTRTPHGFSAESFSTSFGSGK